MLGSVFLKNYLDEPRHHLLRKNGLQKRGKRLRHPPEGQTFAYLHRREDRYRKVNVDEDHVHAGRGGGTGCLSTGPSR